ncbi:MAG: SH3 domain-containing protein [Clostridia bacterium]|nr:SH3 domain-containing protein [Clostridia bacterium]
MKRAVCFILTLLILTLCACKDEDPNSSTVDTLTNADISVLPDDEKDPENREENEIGSRVEAETIKVKKGVAHGIDVSKWQGKIDWQKVAKSGINFAVIRVGFRGEDGKIYPDENFDYNIQQAEKNGILVGVYFFSTAKTENEAKEEAAFTADKIKGYKISLPVVYDCEGYKNTDSRMFSLSADERTQNALAFLQSIEKYGYKGMFYGSKNDLEDANIWNVKLLEKQYKIWVAQYSSPTYPQKENPDYYGKYDMWQYTNRGIVPGVDGNCDMVLSYSEYKESKPINKNTVNKDAAPPKTQQELLYTDANDSVTAKDSVNLRTGPSTKYDVVGTLKSGTFLTRTGIGKNGWSKLIYNGQTVYAITSYLTDKVIEKETEDIVDGIKFTPANDSVTPKDTVNLRSRPSTNGEKVATVKNGTFLTRTAIGANGWSRLSYNGQTVYAITSYLTDKVIEREEQDVVGGMVFTPQSDRVTAKIEVNLRKAPSTDSESVGKLTSGTFIERTAVSDKGWSRLNFNGQTVYAVTSYLTTNAPEISSDTQTSEEEFTEHGMVFTKISPVNVTAKEKTNLRDKPSTDGTTVVHELPNGEYVTKTAVSKSGWARLNFNGQIVYAIDSFLR